MPGGKVDFGEHPEQTVMREIKEETDLDCEFHGLKGMASEIVHNNNEKVAHLVLYVCKLKPIHTNIKMRSEGEIKWFDLGELDNIDISKAKEILGYDPKKL